MRSSRDTERNTTDCGSVTEQVWSDIVNRLDFAFQPIVNIHTGICYGFEVLLRNFEQAGFDSIPGVFNRAYSENALYFLDMSLREKVLKKFTRLPFYSKMKLFYNIDNRILTLPEYSNSRTSDTINGFDINPGSFCFEISERHGHNMLILNDYTSINEIKRILNNHKQDFFKFAIDDFGTGLSGLQLLYHSEPDYIKIDRFFITNIANDSRKKLFVAHTVKMAHILGIVVIAEGLESTEEFYACKEIGCDYIQGYLIQRPAMELGQLREKYEFISYLNKNDKRSFGSDRSMINGRIEYIEPIPVADAVNTPTTMEMVFESFRKNKANSFFPVVNANMEPLGVIREKDLKEYVYTPYGKEILKNKSSGNISKFISKMPISEIKTRVESILEIFSLYIDSEGILLTETGKYVGFLSASSLIKLLNEKNIAEARDQNPLTRLPGNTIINRYISEMLDDVVHRHVFVYFDFDNFKPFNDIYGFRQGDRAIVIFSDILKEISNQSKSFIGHIGGDDFFAAFKTDGSEEDEILGTIREIITRFSSDVVSIYSPGDRERGYIVAQDRDGASRSFPLLGVSAGVLKIPRGKRGFSMEDMFGIMAELKKKAKASDSGMYVRQLES